jgi:hypothetical protein
MASINNNQCICGTMGFLIQFFENYFKSGCLSEKSFNNCRRMVLTSTDERRGIADKFLQLWGIAAVEWPDLAKSDPCLAVQAILQDDGIADIIDRHIAFVEKFTEDHNGKKIRKLWQGLITTLSDLLA